MLNRITGHYDEKDWYGEVRIDGNPISLGPSLRLRNHSPTGFAWGYSGSGPAQLALAILLVCVSPELALRYYQRFKAEHLATVPAHAPLSLDVDVKGWVEAQVQHDAERATS